MTKELEIVYWSFDELREIKLRGIVNYWDDYEIQFKSVFLQNNNLDYPNEAIMRYTDNTEFGL